MGALVFSGLIASVFLIFSENLQWIRVGMVAALWAAAIGAMVATKYRKDAAVDQAKVRDLQKVYELQLDREISARREYEMGVEARVRAEVGAEAAELAALRAELAVLRQSLERLFDGDLPVDRPALRAEAVRVRELTDGGAGSEADANGSSADARAGSATPVFDPAHPHPPAFAGPDDEPVTAETAIVPADYEPAADIGLGSGSWPHAFHAVGDAGAWADVFAEADTPAEPETGTARPGTAEADIGRSAAATPAASSQVSASGPGVPLGAASGRRHREDAGESAGERKLTVAEIMANLAAERQRSS